MTDTLPSTWRPPEGTRRIDHRERRRMRESSARIKVCAAGRRSGKTTDGLDYLLVGHGPRISPTRRMFSGALCPPVNVEDPTYVVAAPTYEMVERLWWPRIKARLVPEWIASIRERPKMTIELVNGARIICMGMDRPTRSEGMAIDGFIADEYAYFKDGAFVRSVRPALSTRGRVGWAILMFKPDGRNHAFELWEKAKNGELEEHGAFHWKSSEVLPSHQLRKERDSMDERSFQQEYEASFLTQAGRVFYPWDAARHVRKVEYQPGRPLIFALDFNVSPGAAVVAQEQVIDGEQCTVVLWEHYKADDNNSRVMVEEFCKRWVGKHSGEVLVYGDVGGHQRRTSSSSTDWAIIMELLRPAFPHASLRVGRKAPGIVDSVNAVNARLCSGANGKVRLYVSPECRETIKDFEGVVWDDRPGADRQIDKTDGRRTHWVDALRYYIHEKFPVGGGGMVSW